MESKTLLEKAKEIKSTPRNKSIEGMEELALAWCRDEINLTQIARVLSIPGTGHQVYAKIALSLKEYLNKNYKI